MNFLCAKREFIGVFAILLAVVSLAYANTLHTPFQFDDEKIKNDFYEIAHKKNDATSSSLKNRQVFVSTLALNFKLGQFKPFGYHLFNLLLHSCATNLVFLVAWITLSKGGRWSRGVAISSAFVAALLFALNPVLSEAVTYVTGRSSSLSTVFSLLAFYLFILGSLRRPGVGLPRPLLFLFSMMAYFAAVSSKEVAMVLILVMIVYDLGFMQSQCWIERKKRLLWFYILFPVLVILFLMKATTSVSIFKWWLGQSDYLYALAQIKILCYAIKLFLFPINLAIEYESSYSVDIAEPAFVVSVMFICLVLFLLIKAARRSFVIFFSGIWFFIAIAPTNGFIPREDLFSERNLYLPAFGMVLLISVLMHLSGNNRIAQGVKPCDTVLERGTRLSLWAYFVMGLLFILTSNSALLISRNVVYRTPVSFWEDTYKKNPKKLRVLYNLSLAYLETADYKNALVILRKMQSINPSDYSVHMNLAKAYINLGYYKLAEMEYKNAIQYNSGEYDAYFNLGSLYASLGLNQEAVKMFEIVNRSTPTSWDSMLLALFYSAQVYYALERYGDAEGMLAGYLSLINSTEAYVLRAKVYLKTGREALAEKSLREDIVSDPVQQAIAQNLLGLLYIKQGRIEEAQKALEQSIAFNSVYFDAYYNLGKLLINEKKDPDQGLVYLKKALDTNNDPQRAEMVKDAIASVVK